MTEAISIVMASFNILSILGSIFIFSIYCRSSFRNDLSYNLIIYLTIGDTIFSIANLIYIDPGSGYQSVEHIRCQIQGFLIQYSQLVCFIFCFFLCLCLYLGIVKKNEKLPKFRFHFIGVGFLAPLVFAIIPLVTNVYGTQIYICGFASDNNSQTDNHDEVKWESFSLFFLPLWILGFTNLVLIVRVGLYITNQNKQLKEKSALSQENSSIGTKLLNSMATQITQRLIMSTFQFPIIMLICWFPSTIYSLSKLFTDEGVGWLDGPRFIMSDMVGFLNAIIFYIQSRRTYHFIQALEKERNEGIHLVETKNSGSQLVKSYLTMQSEIGDFFD